LVGIEIADFMPPIRTFGRPFEHGKHLSLDIAFGFGDFLLRRHCESSLGCDFVAPPA